MKQQSTLLTVREYFFNTYINGDDPKEKISAKFIEEFAGRTIGSQPDNVAMATVGDITFECNGRRPKAKDIMRLIRQEGGINWYLFGTLSLAKIGTRYDAWDTLHRCMLACAILGPDAKVPALVTPFPDTKTMWSTFWKVNGPRSKKTTSEQNWIAQVKSEEFDTDQSEEVFNILSKTGNTVLYENEEIYEPRCNSTVWKVRYKPVEDILKITQSHDDVIRAFKLYKDVFKICPPVGIKPKEINGQMLKALAFILVKQDSFLGGKTKSKWNSDIFEDWLTGEVESAPNLEKYHLYKNYSHDRMEKRHIGTAFGLWDKFVDWYNLHYESHLSSCDMQDLYYDSLPKKQAA